MKSILITASDPKIIAAIQNSFQKGFTVNRADSMVSALRKLETNRYDLMFIDLDLLTHGADGNNFKEALQPFWKLIPTLEIIVLAPQKMIRKAVMAVKAGARDYLTYPIDPEEVQYITESINDSILMESELDYLRDRFWQKGVLELIQTKNPMMKSVFDKIRSVAPTKSTVLLVGETGTGKSLMAKLIHQHSNRRDAQFISVHCGAIPDTLLESELFGHEKGAFTGAIRRKLGKFEIAKGGTIFLDEIGTISQSAQIKLLQILQDGTFQRVGGEEALDANVRVIAATNADLKKMCDSGEFRKDLYYRLNVFPIEIPPLGDRREDIPLLVESILTNLNALDHKQMQGATAQVMAAFESYDWPGNIRELENLIERAYILETASVLTPMGFPQELIGPESCNTAFLSSKTLTLAEARQHGIEDIEKVYLKDLLNRNKGKINESAQQAGISTRQLNKLMNKYVLKKEMFK